MNAIAKAIRTAREKRGWTQADLAAQLHVTQGTISFWENGIEAPALDHQIGLIELMPEILSALAAAELALLDRIQALERVVFNGRCSCAGCTCSTETPATPISRAARDSSE